MNTVNEKHVDLQVMKDEEILSLSVHKPEVFSELVDRYQEKFVKKAFFILRDEREAEDAVQDTFVKIYMNAKKFRTVEGATFKSWGYKILVNSCFTRYKKMKRTRQFSFNLDPELSEIIPDKRELSMGEQRLDNDYILSLMSKLPNLLHKTFSLHFISGKSHEQIAEIEGVNVGVVRTRLHRAREVMKEASANLPY
ncbi:RNA polymerase sigma factor [Candidatus Parcubacteria bacterium]|nr:RNA polymerase sigma factor [Candidatus Parcubacteria bacterium]